MSAIDLNLLNLTHQRAEFFWRERIEQLRRLQPLRLGRLIDHLLGEQRPIAIIVRANKVSLTQTARRCPIQRTSQQIAPFVIKQNQVGRF